MHLGGGRLPAAYNMISTHAPPVALPALQRAALPADFLVPSLKLWFQLGSGEEPTRVRCELSVERSPSCRPGAALLLIGST